jgi:hypothetical protein
MLSNIGFLRLIFFDKYTKKETRAQGIIEKPPNQNSNMPLYP